jgi:hypothetical protein
MRTTASPTRPATETGLDLGAGTEAVLGYSAEEIARLRNAGIV